MNKFWILCSVVGADPLNFKEEDCSLTFNSLEKSAVPDAEIVSKLKEVDPKWSACIDSPEAVGEISKTLVSRQAKAEMAGGKLTVTCPESSSEFSFNYFVSGRPFVIEPWRQLLAGWTTDVFLKRGELPTDPYHSNLLKLCDKLKERKDVVIKTVQGIVEARKMAKQEEELVRQQQELAKQQEESAKQQEELAKREKAPGRRAFTGEKTLSAIHTRMMPVYRYFVPKTSTETARKNEASDGNTSDETIELSAVSTDHAALEAVDKSFTDGDDFSILKVGADKLKITRGSTSMEISGKLIGDLFKTIRPATKWGSFYEHYRAIFGVYPLVKGEVAEDEHANPGSPVNAILPENSVLSLVAPDSVGTPGTETLHVVFTGPEKQNEVWDSLQTSQFKVAAETFIATNSGVYKLMHIHNKRRGFFPSEDVQLALDIVPIDMSMDWLAAAARKLTWSIPKTPPAGYAASSENGFQKLAVGRIRYISCTRGEVVLYRFRPVVQDFEDDIHTHWECHKMFKNFDKLLYLSKTMIGRIKHWVGWKPKGSAKNLETN